MLIRSKPPLHLTYCLNVHPGETWAENLTSIATSAIAVRDRLGWTEPFGLGLRLSARAAGELLEGDRLGEFRRFLGDNGLYVFTINGFPYGQFHKTAVKQDVYRPDWRQESRLTYTLQLADILAGLLGEGVTGSISTVPGSYKSWISGASQVQTMVANLAAAAMHLDELRARTGREICLALEPEPDCYIETTDEAIAFFAGPMKETGAAWLEAGGRDERSAAEILARHVGLCFDTSHMAVEFEDIGQSLDALTAAGVRVAKIHLSSALSAGPGVDAPAALAAFDERVYLHQVKVRAASGAVLSYNDLPDALDSADPSAQWRVHFHVPLFFSGRGDLEPTTAQLIEALPRRIAAGTTEHLEIETYTFGVLPPDLAAPDLPAALAREYEWVFNHLLPRP
ncbi:MAG: metabolite traffic protein EboE [Planctomycetaceae bacterium]|nr:metabolite traffic protein EboE [Planctomycetaceae bacterium]